MQSSRIQKGPVALGLVLVLALFLLTLSAQTPGASAPAAGQTPDAPKAVFKQTVHDFGEARRGDPLSHTFIVKNEGKGPLNILSVNPG